MSTKRGNREGSIYQRSDGRWVAQIALPGDSRTKRQRKTLYGRTREEVRRKQVDVQSTLLSGQHIPNDQLTVAEFSEEWRRNIRPTVRFKTFETYESVVKNHIIRHIGSVRMTRLKASHIQAMYVELLDEGLSPSSVAKLHTILHNMLEKAVRWDRVVRNVSRLVDVPRPERREKVMLSPKEVRRFLETAKGHRLEALFTLAVTTGARSGELLGLTWDNVDLDTGYINIQASLQKLESGYGLGDPKTKRSRREIALSTIAARSLTSHRARQSAEAFNWVATGRMNLTSCLPPKLARSSTPTMY